jgi:hypothetical protein
MKRSAWPLLLLSAALLVGQWRAPAAEPEVFEKRVIATQENIFETTLEADGKKQSVDDIIAAFKNAKS